MQTDPINRKSVISRWERFFTVPLVGMALALLMPTVAISESPATVDLGTASSFVVLAAAGIANTGNTVLDGDIGSYPTATITGFPPGIITGTNYGNSETTRLAMLDLNAAYLDAEGRTGTPIAAELGGTTQVPGVYSVAAAFSINGTLTLDAQGDPNAVFIFQMGSTLTTAVSSTVNLINGAQWTNVFWQVGSSATLEANSIFQGTILANTSITVNSGATINNGRLLAGAVTETGGVVLNENDVSLPVTLSEFSATVSGGTVHLSWITSSEVENLGFMIERRESGGEWLEIASFREYESLAGHGNTSAEHQYAYTDSKVIPGKTYSYRLLDVDYSGKVITHNDLVRTVTVPEATGVAKSFELVGAYPNPFNPLTTIAFNVPETAPIQLTIYNVLGQKIRILQNGEYQPGFYKISWNATDDHGRLVPAGVYFVQIASGQISRVQKVILLN